MTPWPRMISDSWWRFCYYYIHGRIHVYWFLYKFTLIIWNWQSFEQWSLELLLKLIEIWFVGFDFDNKLFVLLYNIYGFIFLNKGVPEFDSIPNLCDVLTNFIYTCSVEHSATNFPQYEQYSFPPNFAATLHGQPSVIYYIDLTISGNCIQNTY